MQYFFLAILIANIHTIIGGKYKASGGEAGLDFYVVDDLVARANYSYQFIWNDEAGTRVSYSPLSKANAELRYDPKRGVNAAAWVNYVGETNWTSSAQSEDWLPPYTPTTRTGTDPKVSAYFLVNIKTGYRFTKIQSSLSPHSTCLMSVTGSS